MERLILFRHAEARSRAPGQSDFDRPLSEAGRFDAALMGRVLAGAGYAPDRALVSAALRTRQTWEALSAAFPDAREQESKSLYNATAEQVARAAQAAGRDVGTLMVIGHNPGLQLYGLSLAASGSAGARRLDDSFPTATAAVFVLDAQGRPTFERLFIAKDFGGQA
jgi:phosphohistidine phosphatase